MVVIRFTQLTPARLRRVALHRATAHVMRELRRFDALYEQLEPPRDEIREARAAVEAAFAAGVRAARRYVAVRGEPS